jgi:hypothetical protein
MTQPIRLIAGVVTFLLAFAAPVAAFDAEQTFKKGTFVLSGEGAYGWQFNFEDKSDVTYLEFYDVGVRLSLLPLAPLGRDHFWYGSLEMGFEPLYQKYTDRDRRRRRRHGPGNPRDQVGLRVPRLRRTRRVVLRLGHDGAVRGVPLAARLQRQHERAQPGLRSPRRGGRRVVLLPLR